MDNSYQDDKSNEVNSEQKMLISSAGQGINQVHPRTTELAAVLSDRNDDMDRGLSEAPTNSVDTTKPSDVGKPVGKKGKQAEELIWVIENEQTKFKLVHGKKQAMSDVVLKQLAEAINEATKDDKDKNYEEYYSDVKFDRDDRTQSIGRQPANLRQRKLDIFACDESFDTFLKEQFKEHGIKNVFGEPIATYQKHFHRKKNLPPLISNQKVDKQNKWEDRPLKLVDSKITTHHVGNNTYFVLTGFKKGIKLVDSGDFAQGIAILQIFKLTQDPENILLRIHYRELSNIDYEYLFCKNWKPVAFNKNSIWYFVLENKLPFNITKQLYSFNLDDDENGNIIGERKDDKTYKEEAIQINGISVFAASVSFSSSMPRSEELGSTEFKRSQYATFYYRSIDAKKVKNLQGVEQRKEYYGYYITRSLKDIDLQAEYHDEQFHDENARVKKIGKEIPVRYSFEEGDAQDTVLQVFNTRAVERNELYHKRNFKSTLRNSKIKEQIEHMMSKPFYYCYRAYGADKSKILEVNEEKLNELPQVFGIKRGPVDIYKTKNNINNVLQCVNLVDEDNLSQITVVFLYNGELIYQMYKNERIKEYHKYDYSKLNPMSKFVRYRAWGKQMYGKYDNLFLQVSHKKNQKNNENERWVFYKRPAIGDQPEQWYEGNDKERTIFTQEHFDNYFVFDIINNEKRYDVSRIETGQNNHDIRFRLRGGDNEGLYLCITDYNTDVEIVSKKMTDLFDAGKYQNTGVAWSSQQYNLKKYVKFPDRICQNLQWSVISENKMHAYFFEYRIVFIKHTYDKSGQLVFCDEHDSKIHDGIQYELETEIYYDKKGKECRRKVEFQTKIQLIQIKDVLMNTPYLGWGGKNWFFPAYNSEDKEIDGTQWIPTGFDLGTKLEDNQQYFKMFNLVDKDYTNKTDLVKSMYKVFKQKKIYEHDVDLEYTFCESAIGDKLEEHYEKFTESEIFTILNDETRTTLNMVPSKLEDIVKMDFHADQYDPFQPLEILAGQCIADYFLNEPEQINLFCTLAMEEQERSEDRKTDNSRLSILDEFLEKSKSENKLDLVDYFFEEGIKRQKHTLSQDFLSSNPLRKCFDYRIGQDDEMNKSAGISTVSFMKQIKNRWKRVKEMLIDTSVDDISQEILEQEFDKLKAKHLKSAQYLVSHILNKKDMSEEEHKFIMISMKFMLENNINFGKFFSNIYEEGRFVVDELKLDRYCQLVEMNELPEYSKDKAVIRILQHRVWPLMDVNSDEGFLRRKFTENYEKTQFNHLKNLRFKIGFLEDESQEEVKDLTKKQLDHIRGKKSMAFFEDPKKRMGTRIHGQNTRKVNSFIIDHSDIELEIKRQQLLQGRKIDFQYNLFELTSQMRQIIDQYKLEIEHFPVLQQIINSLFHRTWWFFAFQICLYITYIVPFGLQMLYYDHLCRDENQVITYCADEFSQKRSVVICNIICLIVACLFFVIDLVQLWEIGAQGYFSEAQNVQDFAWFFIQSGYCIFRIVYQDTILPLSIYWKMIENHNLKLDEQEKSQKLAINTHPRIAQNVDHIVIYAFLNLILIYIAVKKVMFFMTIQKNFGTMIRLVERSIRAIREFLVYFFMMIMVMSCLVKALGYDIGDPDPIDASKFVSSADKIWNYFKHTFLNSVGGIEEPTVDFWTSDYGGKDDLKVSNYIGNESVSLLMEVTIWLSWFFSVFLLFIVLCNFMISYISQTYEDVLEMQTEDTYECRCQLNYEFYVMLKFYYEKIIFKDPKEYNFNCFLLTADFDKIDKDPNSNENTGFTKKIKGNLDEHQLIMKNQIKVLRKEIDELVQLSGKATEKKFDQMLSETKHDIISEIKRMNFKSNMNVGEQLLDKEKEE